MKIINKTTGATIKEIIGGETLTLDEAINLVGEIHNFPMEQREDVEIGGNWYYYEDLGYTK